jgi:hypothetical protein
MELLPTFVNRSAKAGQIVLAVRTLEVENILVGQFFVKNETLRIRVCGSHCSHQ